MLFVLEGVDCTGKTSLAARLQEELGAEVQHFGPPRRHPLLEYEAPLQDYVPGAGQHLVLDRFHLGERVWPHVFGRGSMYADEIHLHVELLLQAKGALLVHCTDDYSTVLERLGRRGDDKLRPEKLAPAMARFNRETRRSLLPRNEYRISENGGNPSYLIEAARRCERHQTEVAWSTPEYLGSWWPRVLLVGDERGPRWRGDPNGELSCAPFLPAPGTSGAYLMQTLVTSSLALPNGVGVVNAYRDGERQHLHAIWNATTSGHVVALGRRAHEALEVEQVPHGVAPHPQYVRRFYYFQYPRYAAAILDAAKYRADVRDRFPNRRLMSAT